MKERESERMRDISYEREGERKSNEYLINQRHGTCMQGI